MKVRRAETKDQAAWDAFVKAHHAGLPYHLFAWKQATERAYGLEAVYLLAEEGERITGVLPLIVLRGLSFKRHLVSLPYCDVGGGLASDSASLQALVDEACRIAEDRQMKSVELRWAEAPNDRPSVTSGAGKVRMLLDLPGDSELLMKSFKAKLRSQVRKPARDGLTAKLGGQELLADFYGVFSKNMRDLGSPVHSRKWIETIVSTYDTAARVAVVYTPDGIPAAAGIILIHPNVVSIPWASSLREFNRQNPNMLLYWTFLSYAADQGLPRFDFGRSTPGQGTYRFKEQWGAQPVPLTWENALAPDSIETTPQSPSKARAVVEKVWAKLPLPLTTTLGPWVRQRISL